MASELAFISTFSSCKEAVPCSHIGCVNQMGPEHARKKDKLLVVVDISSWYLDAVVLQREAENVLFAGIMMSPCICKYTFRHSNCTYVLHALPNQRRIDGTV